MLMKISIVLAFLLTLTWGQSLAADLKQGDMAPDFSLPGSDGKTYSLKQFKGKQVVVLAWFPKAFTGG
jgi:peroxiredoxin Q/BCP